MNDFSKKWNQFWSAEYPAKGLALYRILLCLLFLTHLYGVEMVGLTHMDVAEDYFATGFYSPYFSWLLPPSYEVFIWLGRACFLFTLFALVGFLTQFSLFAAVGIFTYLFLLNKLFYYNHLYSLMIAVFLASFAPVGKVWSVDWLIARLRGKSRQKTYYSWAIRMMQVVVSIIYLASAISKTNMEWCSGDIMKTLEEFGPQPSQDGSYLPPPWLGFLTTVPYAIQAVGGIAIEYIVGIGLWIKKIRIWILALGIGFHWYMGVTMHISTFSWQMAVYYLLFLMEFPLFQATISPHAHKQRQSPRR